MHIKFITLTLIIRHLESICFGKTVFRHFEITHFIHLLITDVINLSLLAAVDLITSSRFKALILQEQSRSTCFKLQLRLKALEKNIDFVYLKKVFAMRLAE